MVAVGFFFQPCPVIVFLGHFKILFKKINFKAQINNFLITGSNEHYACPPILVMVNNNNIQYSAVLQGELTCGQGTVTTTPTSLGSASRTQPISRLIFF